MSGIEAKYLLAAKGVGNPGEERGGGGLVHPAPQEINRATGKNHVKERGQIDGKSCREKKEKQIQKIKKRGLGNRLIGHSSECVRIPKGKRAP
jgi:hypothetical protein